MSEKNNTKREIAMPLGVADWLITNTQLTFDQIADFCGLHPAKIHNIGGEDASMSVLPVNPIEIYLTKEEINRCTKDKNARLNAIPSILNTLNIKAKPSKEYVSLVQKRHRLDAITWLVKFYPELTTRDIAKLVKSTPATVSKIKDGSHKEMLRLIPKNPVILGLCSKEEFGSFLKKRGIKKEI